MLADRQFGHASAELRKSAEKTAAEEAASLAAALLLEIAAQARTALTEAREWIQAGRIYEADRRLAEFSGAGTHLDLSAEIEQELTKIRNLPLHRKEVSGGKVLLATQVKEFYKLYDETFENYKDLAKQYEGTGVADVALRHARKMIEDGKIGYDPACSSCRDADRACGSHRRSASL